MIPDDVAYVAPALAYASAGDLLTLDDRPQVALRIARWNQTLLVRALSLDAQEQITRAARRKDALTGQIVTDRTLFVAETLRLACVQPQLDAAQAKALTAKNATILDALVDAIWGLLGRLDHTQIADLVRAAADLESETDDAGIDDPAG